MTNDQVGAWVKRRRTQLKLGVGTAAKRADISRQTWYSLERGAYPPNDDTQRGVAEALRVEPDWYDRLMTDRVPITIASDRRELLADIAAAEEAAYAEWGVRGLSDAYLEFVERDNPLWDLIQHEREIRAIKIELNDVARLADDQIEPGRLQRVETALSQLGESIPGPDQWERLLDRIERLAERVEELSRSVPDLEARLGSLEAREG